MWVNEDTTTHDVTATQFHDTAVSWDLARDLPVGESVTYTFERDGVYQYSCAIHGAETMCGVVLVGNVVFNADLPCHEGDSGY